MPGGVPLRWLGYAVVTLIGAIVVSSQSPTVALLAAAAAGAAGLAWGGRSGAVAATLGALLLVPLAGWIIGSLDWPLRLVVLPALAATLATQATPDGRAAHCYLAAWLRVRLDGGRRSAGRSLPLAGARRRSRGRLWVASDQRAPELRRARLRGPAMVNFRNAVLVRRRWRRRTVRTLSRVRRQRGWAALSSIELDEGERVELRP